jgi:hypothetical protein
MDAPFEELQAPGSGPDGLELGIKTGTHANGVPSGSEPGA